ncbi:hypothetical protein M9H77_36400 [Catharanthus roseus]|uniref:Uncharacterized protein n=1 Tax=Catharanthus roseus TaxID=4058 RepID=A0ACB9ZVE4_CATRO|nr:hypothetical protein M9H77_36400 [Catharanthus roseus]
MLEFWELINAPLRNGYKGWKATWCNKKFVNNCIGLFLEEGQKGTTRPAPKSISFDDAYPPCSETSYSKRESVGQTKKDRSQMKVKGEVNFGPKQACIPSASKAEGKRSVANLDGSKEEEEGSVIEDSSYFAADSDVVFGEETKGATFNYTNAKD